ncbi:alpha/beta hydrolase [Millisia brevis]|uniref:alpha/beta hydrolase n=1 Tax=Millisia brevis TaxID=264148 RepID=UPI00082ADB96|nr:alpha/beta-hydrolase family protein [Millisia brevis]
MAVQGAPRSQSVGPQRLGVEAIIRIGDRHPAVVWAWEMLRLDLTGIVFGAVFFCWSLTPSLLPRNWIYQGVVAGISGAVGYGVGALIGWFVWRRYLRNWHRWPPPPRVRQIAYIAIPSLAVIVGAIMLVASAKWQRELAALTDSPGTTTGRYLIISALSGVISAALIASGRLLRDMTRWVTHGLRRRIPMPRLVANVLGVIIVIALANLLIEGLLLRGAISVADSVFSTANDDTRAGLAPPSAPERSGSSDSLIPWQTLGREGRNFVTGGLHRDELLAASGRPSREPIRAYVGLQSAPTPEARMDLLMRELDRTGAMQRKAVIIIPTTGTGWVNPTAARAAEVMLDGDTAIIASQYSYLPSWISFLVDRDRAAEAGNTLINAVRERWLAVPEGQRPKLYVYGESLGTSAGEGAFTDLTDIREKVDGVLWVGPPNSNRIWETYVTRRDPGSTEVSPVYAGGLVVRFANSAANIDQPATPWLRPRVLYLQHPSDPVVWWSPHLLISRPDWLSEPPGADRLPSMRWFPIVTFWQVSADLGNAAGVPDGHGHNYGTAVLDGWVAIAAPDGWTAADTERARATVELFAERDGPEK